MWHHTNSDSRFQNKNWRENENETKNKIKLSLSFAILIDEIYTIFLLKKNIRTNIIKTILEYLLVAVLEILKE